VLSPELTDNVLRGLLRTVRYAHGWTSGAGVRVEETEIEREGVRIPATLLLPARGKGPFPGWIAMGGITRMGRFHPQLVRFGNALASSGAAVLLPEIPEWQKLEVPPSVTGPTLRGAIQTLGIHPEVLPGKVGLIGFSFGAPQVAIAAAREELADHVAGIVLFGGYCCLDRTLLFGLTGDHEWEGVDYSLTPDPYGRWVVASNYLADIPGCEDAHDVAAALRCLATATSDQRIPAWEPHHDAMIRDLRLALPKRHQALFDLFATPTTGTRPDRDECADIGLRLADACRRVDPLLEPAPDLAKVHLPTQLIHGRGDRLIPFTEGMRMVNGLPSTAEKSLTVTGMFAHSATHSPPGLFDKFREGTALFGAVRSLINTV